MTFRYDQSLAAPKDLVRFLVGDKNDVDPKLQDEEILAQLALTPDTYDAAVACCRRIAASYASFVDQRQEAVDSKDSQLYAHYMDLAAALRVEKMLYGSGDVMPWAGGLSQRAKDDADLDCDLVQPMIRRTPNAPRETND